MSTTFDIQVLQRYAEKSDLSFIFSSWLKSFRGSPLAASVENAAYFDGHHRLIEGVLRHARVLCAVSSEDPSQIYGWVCYEIPNAPTPPVVHYVYVKHSFRGFGIAKRLLARAAPDAFVFTHMPAEGRTTTITAKGKYNPYAAFKGMLP